MPEGTLDTGLRANAASCLAYITFLPAIVLLITPPFNESLTVRFHAWQSIFLNMVLLGSWIVLYVLGMIPLINLMDVILIPLAVIVFVVLWIALLVNTFNGRRSKLPYLGDLAEQQASIRRSA